MRPCVKNIPIPPPNGSLSLINTGLQVFGTSYGFGIYSRYFVCGGSGISCEDSKAGQKQKAGKVLQQINSQLGQTGPKKEQTDRLKSTENREGSCPAGRLAGSDKGWNAKS